jgi:hypothetical protein
MDTDRSANERRLLTSNRSFSLLAALLIWMVAPTADAETELYESNGFSINLGLEIGAGAFVSEGTNFGAGRVDLLTGSNTGDADWYEGYVEPSIRLDYQAEDFGRFYGGASAVGALTLGEGDAGGFTAGTETDIDPELLYAGWSSGTLFAESLGDDAIDISAGRQNFTIGDGFLIWDGNFDAFGDGTFWLAPRTAFSNSAIARFDTSPVRGDAFFLEGDNDQDNTELAGINLEYVPEGIGTFGVTYIRVLDQNAALFGPRDDADIFSFRINDLRVPGVEDLSLWGEYVLQNGSGSAGKIDADAFYAEANYTFSSIAWMPTIGYRFAYFSGDSDPTDGTSEAFDPLFYGFSRGWGTWFQGEVTGEYLLFNSNQVNHMISLSASPTDSVGIGAIYYHFDLDEKNYFGTPVTDESFADEINVYLDWAITENVSMSAVYGVAFPGKAARQVFGDDEAFQIFETFLTISY